jgi:hypothetical protein
LLSNDTKIIIYRTVIFHVVLNGCETWSLTFRKERRQTVIENRVLRRTVGPKSDEIIGQQRKPHNEELNDLYFSLNTVWMIKSRRMKRVRHVARTGERRGVYRVLVGKPEEKSPLGRPRLRWEDNNKIFRKWNVGLWTGSI